MAVIANLVRPSILMGGQKTSSDRPEPFQGTVDDARYELYSRPVANPLADTFVFHDTVGSNWSGMVAGSNKRCRDENKCLGVTFTNDGKGQLRQHQSLLRRSNHAGFVNDRAHGIETVNIFDPAISPPKHPGQKVVGAKWSGNKSKTFVMPSPAQLESGWELVYWLSKLPASEGGGLVLDFPGVVDGQYYWGTIPGVEQGFKPGVYAHGHLTNKRQDGYPQAAYAYLRSQGFDKAAAYDAVVKMSEGVRQKGGIWVSDVPRPPVVTTKMIVAGFGVLGVAGLGAWLIMRNK